MTQRTPPGRWRLLLPAALVWMVTAIVIGLPGLSRTLFMVLIVVSGVIATCVLFPRTRQLARSLVSVAGVSLGCLALVLASIQLTEHARKDPFLTEAQERGIAVTIDVTIDSFPDHHPQTGETQQPPRFRLPARVTTPAGDVKLMLWGSGDVPPGIVPGSLARVRGTLTTAEPARSEGYAVNVVDMEHLPGTRMFEGYARTLTTLREELVAVSARHPMAQLVPGFAVGDTTLVSDALDAAMKVTSLTHLIAVSGANCALITGFVIAVAGRCGATRRPRIVLAAATLMAFVLLVGPDASIQRAAIMAAVTLMSQFGGKSSAGYPALGVAMLCLLIMDPWQSRQPGFTLSVAATWGIMMFTPWIERQLVTRFRFPRWLALTIAVTTAAQFSCGPLLLLLQEGLPVGGLIANVLAAPAAPMGTGLGLAAMLSVQMSDGLGSGVVYVAGLASGWVVWIAETLAGVPGLRWHWPGGPGGAVLLALAQGMLVAAVTLRQGTWDLGRGRAWPKPVPWAEKPPVPIAVQRMFSVLTALGLGIFLAIVVTIPITERLRTPTDWEVVMCDVGQGDAIATRSVHAPEDVILTDTGADPERLRACLSRFGISRIALLVLSHDDQDHVGALEEVLSITEAAIVSPETTDSTGRHVVEVLEAAGIPTRIGNAGDSGVLGAGNGGDESLKWRILAPPQGARATNNNDSSIVMEIDTGNLRMLMLGDTGEAGHAQLLRRYPRLRVDVVKVAHHGSKDQDPSLLLQIDADYGLISSGAGNRYGHPHETVLETLRVANTQTVRTDERGSVALRVREGNVTLWTER